MPFGLSSSSHVDTGLNDCLTWYLQLLALSYFSKSSRGEKIAPSADVGKRPTIRHFSDPPFKK